MASLNLSTNSLSNFQQGDFSSSQSSSLQALGKTYSKSGNTYIVKQNDMGCFTQRNVDSRRERYVVPNSTHDAWDLLPDFSFKRGSYKYKVTFNKAIGLFEQENLTTRKCRAVIPNTQNGSWDLLPDFSFKRGSCYYKVTFNKAIDLFEQENLTTKKCRAVIPNTQNGSWDLLPNNRLGSSASSVSIANRGAAAASNSQGASTGYVRSLGVKKYKASDFNIQNITEKSGQQVITNDWAQKVGFTYSHRYHVSIIMAGNPDRPGGAANHNGVFYKGRRGGQEESIIVSNAMSEGGRSSSLLTRLLSVETLRNPNIPIQIHDYEQSILVQDVSLCSLTDNKFGADNVSQIFKADVIDVSGPNLTKSDPNSGMRQHFDEDALNNLENFKEKLKYAYKAALKTAIMSYESKQPSKPHVVVLPGLSTNIYAGPDKVMSQQISAMALRDVLNEEVNRIALKNHFDKVVISGFPNSSNYF